MAMQVNSIYATCLLTATVHAQQKKKRKLENTYSVLLVFVFLVYLLIICAIKL
jgi:hypothetical protein